MRWIGSAGNKKPRTWNAGFQVLACDCTCAIYPVKQRVVVVVRGQARPIGDDVKSA